MLQALAARQLQTAERAAIELIRREPSNYLVHGALGQIYRQTDRLAASVDMLEKCVTLNPDDVVGWMNLAQVLYDYKEYSKSARAYARFLSLRPNLPEALLGLGRAMEKLGEAKEAIKNYQKAVEYSPGLAAAQHALGLALLRTNDLDGAAEAYRSLIRILPDHAASYIDLGNILQSQGKSTEATKLYHQAIQINPDLDLAHFNLGVALVSQDRFTEAIAAYKEAIKLRPDQQAAHINLGTVLACQGLPDQAIEVYRQALAKTIDNPKLELQLEYNLGLALLTMGDYEQGWAGHEHRHVVSRLLHQENIDRHLRLWDGDLGLQGELVIVTEQGYGDIFQFMRYAKHLRGKVPRLSIAAEAKIVDFLEESSLFDRVYSLPLEANRFSEDARWVSIMSLPHRLGVTTADVLVRDPYLTISSGKVESWSRRLRNDGEFVVGIHWQGNPEHEKVNLKGRSLPLEAFRPLADIPGIRFVSLQKGYGSEQLQNCTFRGRFADCQADIDLTWDFLETAALIKACDLVITSDSAVAHLAGALGHPTWLLLRKVADWRWGLQGDTTHWYDSLRLFRQQGDEGWSEVINRVRSELAAQLRFPQQHDNMMTAYAANRTCVSVPVSVGELIDKLTILEIKNERLLDEHKLHHTRHEHSLLQDRLETLKLPEIDLLKTELKAVNISLWEIEDEIRICESNGDFGPRFIELARAVYHINDQRARIKAAINKKTNSDITEQKSYAGFVAPKDDEACC